MKITTVFRTILAGTMATALCACATSGHSSVASRSPDQAIASAETAIAAANANHWIWRDTEKFLSEAKAAAAKGDRDDAIKLADKARTQAELAVKQYETEQKMHRGM